MAASTPLVALINNLLFNLNILTIAVVTGFAASNVKAATDEYLKSNRPVVESGHVVLLVDQWSDSLPPILRQLRIAAADPHAPAALHRPILVLTGRPKAQAQGLLRDAATTPSAGVPRIEVIVRQGDPRYAADVERVCAAAAAHVALLASDADRAVPAGGAVRRKVGVQAALLRQLRRSRPRALLALPPLKDGGWQQLGRDFMLMEDENLVGRLLGVLARPAPSGGVRLLPC
jgi:hypothetical protein